MQFENSLYLHSLIRKCTYRRLLEALSFVYQKRLLKDQLTLLTQDLSGFSSEVLNSLK